MALDFEGCSEALEAAADVLVPIAAWLDSRKFTPPLPSDVQNVPWRDGDGPLSAKKLGVVSFVKGLLHETSQDAELKTYFATRAEEPLALAPFDDTRQWRALR